MPAERHEVAEQPRPIDPLAAVTHLHARVIGLPGDRAHRPEEPRVQRLGAPGRRSRKRLGNRQTIVDRKRQSELRALGGAVDREEQAGIEPVRVRRGPGQRRRAEVDE